MNGIAGVGSSIQYALNSAGRLMDSAAASIGAGDLDNMVDASMDMSMAKLQMGIAVKLSRTQDEMMKSTLDILA